jgi:hypothetical protein
VPRLPRLSNPLDAEDLSMVGRIAVWSLLIVWTAVVLAVAVGLFVRIVLALI